MLPAVARCWRSPDQADAYFRTKRLLTIGPSELNDRLHDDGKLVLIDVRDAEDFADGHLPGAVHFPRDQWSSRDALSQDGVNVIYCGSHRSALAAEAAAEFSGRGYVVIEMDGGFEGWQARNLQVEK